MKRKFYLLLLTMPLLAGVLWNCGGGRNARQNPDAASVVSYNPLVSAFTSGTISRFSDVRIIFSRDIDQSKLNASAISKFIKFKPAVAGEFGFEDDHTILFRPSGEFAPNTTYNVTVDLGGWFDVVKDTRNFAFSFSTIPLTLRASSESFDVDEDGYRYLFAITSRDRETPETVETLIALSEKANTEWEHSADGKRHELTVSRVTASEKEREIEVSVAPNNFGADTGVIASAAVPGKGSFDIYDVAAVFYPERYIEVVFTHRLDRKQNLNGLVFIEGNVSTAYTIRDNKVRLYPDANRNNTINVYIDESVQTADGKKLGKTVVRQVNINNLVPAVRFVGKGVIIPNTDNLMVPFEAVYLRGVTVSIIKIFENNIGQFLQTNQLDKNNNMKRVGRLIAHKTIFFEDEGYDLKRWNTFAINLNDFITPEPEAIYRIKLSFDKELSAYDMCDEKPASMTQAEIARRDEEEMARMLEYDYDRQGSYYYDEYYDDYYYYDDYEYEYDEDNYYYNNPCDSWFYYNRSKSRNVLATNLGLTIKIGEAREAVAIVNNILTTQPESGVTVELFNYQQQLVGKGTTGADGTARFEYTGGRPYYAVASLGKQRTYMRVDDGSSLSTSAFDVSGEVVQKGVKGFIYGDRGVWRPGDTINLTFMLNDRDKSLPADQPVIMELYNPQGRLFVSRAQNLGANGIYAFSVDTEESSPTGLWKAIVKVGGLRFTKSVRVETVKPNRLKIDLTVPEKVVLANKTFKMPMHAEWLTGATARGLEYNITGTVMSIATGFDKFAGYIFDDPAKSLISSEVNVARGTVDNMGNADVNGMVRIGGTARGMTRVNLFTQVFEESGEFSIDGRTITCSPYERYAGIKSPVDGEYEQLNTGEKHTFSVALVDYEGRPVKGNLNVEVYKLEWYWWWGSNDGRLANYMSDSYLKPVKEMKVQTGANGTGTFELSFENKDWGNYYIRVSDGIHTTGITQRFDWPYYWGKRRDDGSDSAFKLNFTTNNDTYAPGEDIIITLPSSAGSRAIVSVENGSRVLQTFDFVCSGEETTLKIKATADMMPNAYLYVMLLQPYDNTLNDVPIRLYGVSPITVTSEQSRLYPVIATKEEFKPEQNYEITVSERDGRPMSYTLAIVDEGLLDITAFKTPDPWRAFNAKEALGVRSWDMYNYVLGAYGGRIEQMFSIGGDEETLAKVKNTTNRFTPIARFEGPFTLKKGEKKTHTYQMPNYNGRVRVMVVATDSKAYGSAEKSVMVRKPVMLLGTLPRVIGINEEMAVPAAVFATQKGVGKVTVKVECTGNMTIVGNATQELMFTEATDQMARFIIRTGNMSGTGHVKITATAPNGEKSVYETYIEIRSVIKPVTKVVNFILQPGQTWNEGVYMPGMDDTNTMSLELSSIQPIDMTSRLDFLIGYPHGCIEQITSKGFPQLYLKNVAELTDEQSATIEKAVKEVLNKMRDYQTAEGAFAYWPGGTSTYAWATVYATHFMLEAEKCGYLVSSPLKNDAVDNLRAVAQAWKPANDYYSRSEELTQAYRLYVLALTGKPETGAMNRMKERKDLNPMSKWTLAAAYAQAGHKDVAKELISSSGTNLESVNYSYDLTFGSNLRDNSMRLMALCLIDDTNNASMLLKDISKSLSAGNWHSTQTTAFALMSVSKYIEKYVAGQDMSFRYASAAKSGSVSTSKTVWTKEIVSEGKGGNAKLEVSNDGAGVIFGRVIMSGTPEQGAEKAYENNVGLSVRYVDENGNELNIDELPQGVNFKAEITITNKTPMPLRNLVLTNIIPSGWEIINKRFMFGSSSSSGGSISYQDIRDDRVYSYIDYLSGNSRVRVTTELMSAYAGRFYLPPVYCEAMYDNLTQANTEGKEVVVK